MGNGSALAPGEGGGTGRIFGYGRLRPPRSELSPLVNTDCVAWERVRLLTGTLLLASVIGLAARLVGFFLGGIVRNRCINDGKSKCCGACTTSSCREGFIWSQGHLASLLNSPTVSVTVFYGFR